MKTNRYTPCSLVAALVLAAAAMGGTVAHAQSAGVAAATAPGARIGFVNTDRLFSETRAAQQAQAKLKREFSTRENQLQALGNRLKKDIEDYDRQSQSLSETQRQQRQQRLMAQEAEFQQKRREFQDDLNNRKNEELQQLLDRANRVVIQIAKDEQYDVILQEAVYVNQRLDITNKVIAALDAAR